MNTLANSGTARADIAPRLLLEVRDPGARRRHGVAAAGALAVHAGVIAALWWMPATPVVSRPAPVVAAELRKSSTPLVAPPRPFRLTQKGPQRGKPAAEVDISALLPRPAVAQPEQRGAPRPFQPPPGGPEPRRGRELDFDMPRVDLSQALPPPAAFPGAVLPDVPKPAPPRRDNPFEPVGAPSLTPGQPKIAVPSGSVQEAVRSVVKGAGGAGLTVGDVPGPGVSEGLVQTPRPGRPGSSLELLSDPRGIDFRPYLVQVLAAVRRNWYAVMPESARLGARGRTVIQFSISRGGQVPKLVIAVPSGLEALDRAAVASISASNPFPPLPGEFTGPEIRLQLVFSYNMPR